MSWHAALEQEVLHLYQEPVIGSGYNNTYGEANLVNLVKKFHSLEAEQMEYMKSMIVTYSQSGDLSSSYVSVGVLHALGMSDHVANAYQWAEGRDDSQMFTHHFDIGKSLAEHFVIDTP
ncbi:hypothetical protein [Nitrospina watsonii]|uniref:Uncharacterized protein n=1 Tax=Nitrospina watsonii TaxID=1323948 RepID=A0ABN8VVE7_9BACT|nr:hypothetical protein [Nitrospina watsonii]CAI2717648.1 conserved protein of unknown function [Nitrospina watsonii]